MRCALILLVLTGCQEEPLDCDTMAAVSVTVNLSAASGDPLTGAQVAFTAPGESEPQACEHISGTWLCGYEVAGDLLIVASADCHGEHTETVTIEQDECHVVQQTLDIVLDPVDCAAEEIPSVYVTVSDEGGQPIDEATVGYVPEGQDWADYELCEAYDAGWACGWGYSGTIDLEVEAPGYSSWWGQAEVATDCCGPITEQVDVVLPESPDEGG